MISPDTLLDLTNAFLSLPEFQKESEAFWTEKIEELREVIRSHNHLYYIKEEPIILDKEYDDLFTLLKKTEEKFPSLQTDNSPTNSIDLEVQTAFKKVKHYTSMISLDNTYNEEDLRDFDKRLKKIFLNEEAIEYTVELKFDGIGISLLYENDTLIRAATRGDGALGEDVTENIKTITNIPQKVSFQKYGIKKAEVRGEIILPKKELDLLNKKRIDVNEKPFVNCRNAASGSVRQLDPNITKQRNLRGYFYHFIPLEYDSLEDFVTYGDHVKLFQENFFTVSPFFEICQGIENVIQFCEKMYDKKHQFDFDIDGLVVKVNSIFLQKKAGETNHHPRFAIAYKFPAERVFTQMKSVTFQVGRTGVITPVAELQPVKLSGAMISRATLHNFDDIQKKDIRLYDTVEIERAGEVIPAVVRPLREKRQGNEEKIEIPQKCPVCDAPLSQKDNEVAIRCTSVICPAQIKGKIRHFVSRNGMNIEGLGDKLISQLVDKKIFTSLADIYTLSSFEKVALLQKVPGLGQKALSNLFSAIEASKKTKLSSFLFALGIEFIGKKTAQILSKYAKSITDLENLTEEKLLEIHDIGEKTSKSLLSFFQNPTQKKLLMQLEDVGIVFLSEEDGEKDLFSGQKFVFTGSLKLFSRDDATDLVEKYGGNVSSTITKQTNYLVCGENAGSKEQKAKDLGVAILTEDEFLALFPKEEKEKYKDIQKAEKQEQLSLF